MSIHLPSVRKPLETAGQMSKPARLELWPGLVFALLLFGLQVSFWIHTVAAAYFPVGDEFALLTHSTQPFHPHASDWFLHGFSGYFSPYPDLSLPYSNFLRPVANLTYYLASLLFGQHWSAYLLSNYLIQSAMVLVAWYLARMGLKLSLVSSLVVVLASALSPAFSYHVILRPCFAFDLLGGLWALLALTTLMQRRWLLSFCFVTLAVFTKETAYYTAPAVCAGAAMLQWRPVGATKRLATTLAYLLPLAGALLLRRLDFPHGQGVYVLNEAGGGSAVKRLILALTHWPWMLPGEQHIFARTPHSLAALLLSALAWVLILLFAFRLWRARGRDGEGAPEDQRRRWVVAVFLALSLLLPVGLDLGPRFGGSTLPLFFLVLGCLASDANGADFVRWAATALLAIATISDGAALVSSTRQALQHEEALWARSRNMVSLIAREQNPVIFLVGDATESFSSPIAVTRFAHYTGTLVPLSNLGIGGTCADTLLVTQNGNELHIHSPAAPNCGENSMGATFHLTTQPLHRFMRDLPEATVQYDAHAGGWENGHFSARDLDMVLQPKVSSFAILYPPSEASLTLQRVEVADATQFAKRRNQLQNGKAREIPGL